MSTDKYSTSKFAELRRRAQAYLSAAPKDEPALSQKDVKRLVEELNTYQIELELQNEDLRQTHEQLLQSQKRYTDLYDFAPVGYLTISDKGLIAGANLAAAEIFGVERRYLIKRSLCSFFTSGEQDSHYVCQKRLVETKEPQTCERLIQKLDSNELAIHCSCIIRPEVDGDSGQYRMVVTDISQRKSAEQERDKLEFKRQHAEQELRNYSINLERIVSERTKELEDAHKEIIRQEKLAAIGKLAGIVAHDIRNPLGSISNSIYFLNSINIEEENEKTKKHLSIMEREINRASGIINDLMEFSIDRESVLLKGDLNLLLREFIQEINLPDNVQIHYELDSNMPELHFDKSEMWRVFTNLSNNAIQALPDGGQICFKTSHSVANIEIEISDNGIGINKENMPSIFEPLFTTKAKGVGLGLSIVKTFIEKHGGAIKAVSEVGKGTAFLIRLPLEMETLP